MLLLQSLIGLLQLLHLVCQRIVAEDQFFVFVDVSVDLGATDHSL